MRTYPLSNFVGKAAAIAASVILGGNIASAADMPRKAPLLAAATVYNWTGIYVGGHAGYGWSGNSIDVAGGPIFANMIAAGQLPSRFDLDPTGFLGGATLGANWQLNRAVLGVEADISFGSIKGSKSVSTFLPFNVPFVPYTHSGEQRLDWLGTVRGRVGITLADNLLAFATGGLAYGHTETRTSNISNGSALNFTSCAFQPCPTGSSSRTLLGWAAGAGLEYGTGPWSLKVEYLHYDLGNVSYSYNDPVAASPLTILFASTRYSGDIVRGGLNYRFAAGNNR